MDTIATPQTVIEFFAALDTPAPDFSSQETLKAFKKEQDDSFAVALDSFQKARAAWAKELLKLYQLEAAKNPKEEAIEAQREVVAEIRAPYDAAFEVFMAARAREEVARALPATMEDPSAYLFIGRQIEIAESYLKLG